jgi:hypothetical protein
MGAATARGRCMDARLLRFLWRLLCLACGLLGTHIGFYDGVNCGYRYVRVGFSGGRSAGNSFAYKTNVGNVNTTVIHNSYNATVINNVTVNKVSYNGGPRSQVATPTVYERAASRRQHVPPTAIQREHAQEAARNRALSTGGHPRLQRPRDLPFLADLASWEHTVVRL